MKRDDIIEYSLDNHHSEEDGVKIRKKIWFVTALLTIITAAVLLGVFWGNMGVSWAIVKSAFIILTLVKAGYIVMVFMHLGDERKAMRWVILIPYAFFIMYLIFILFYDATVLYNVRMLFGL